MKPESIPLSYFIPPMRNLTERSSSWILGFFGFFFFKQRQMFNTDHPSSERTESSSNNLGCQAHRKEWLNQTKTRLVLSQVMHMVRKLLGKWSRAKSRRIIIWLPTTKHSTCLAQNLSHAVAALITEDSLVITLPALAWQIYLPDLPSLCFCARRGSSSGRVHRTHLKTGHSSWRWVQSYPS